MNQNLKIITFANFFIALGILIYILFKSFQPNLSHSFSDLQNDDYKSFEKYLLENPQVIIKSLESYQKEQMKVQNGKAKEIISSSHDLLYNNSWDPKQGDSDAKIKVVQFFDYNCGYCHKMLTENQKLMKANQDVEIIFKELPILSEGSAIKAQVSIAVYQVDPEKYPLFQEELLKSKQNSTDLQMYVMIAGKLGIDLNTLNKTLNDDRKKIDDVIKNNVKLAVNLGLQGAPAYIIGNELIPGYITYEVFSAKISDQREGN